MARIHGLLTVLSSAILLLLCGCGSNNAAPTTTDQTATNTSSNLCLVPPGIHLPKNGADSTMTIVGILPKPVTHFSSTYVLQALSLYGECLDSVNTVPLETGKQAAIYRVFSDTSPAQFAYLKQKLASSGAFTSVEEQEASS